MLILFLGETCEKGSKYLSTCFIYLTLDLFIVNINNQNQLMSFLNIVLTYNINYHISLFKKTV